MQDAWLKWSAADRSQVADPKAYLVRIVSNLALDRLRSTRHRRETYVGPWLPEPILTRPRHRRRRGRRRVGVDGAAGGAGNAEPAGARGVRPEGGLRLQPRRDRRRRRTSEAAVRQAAHRAREHVQARRPRFTADRSRQREVTERFFAAATGGDINTLMELLAPDVTLWTDGGGKVRQALRPVIGADTVADLVRGHRHPPLPGRRPRRHDRRPGRDQRRPGHRVRGAGRVIATVTFDFDDDRPHHRDPQRRQPRQTARRHRPDDPSHRAGRLASLSGVSSAPHATHQAAGRLWTTRVRRCEH